MSTRLNVRVDCHGGGVRDGVQSSRDLRGYTHLTILIHGYNNDECDAWTSYGEFLRRSRIEEYGLLVGEVCAFYWPGDRAWGKLAFLSYPTELGPARQSAARLFAYLQGLAAVKPIEVSLVCHSLGNRVALELLHAYVAAGAPAAIAFGSTCLMAAAVPAAMVEGGSPLEAAVRAIGRTLVLYSEHDPVLHWAFPAGETLIRGEGWFPTAVGRFGDPSRNVWSDRRNMAPFGHGDYWTSDGSASEVRGFLGISTPRSTPSHRVPAHALPPAGAPDERHLPERTLAGGRPACC